MQNVVFKVSNMLTTRPHFTTLRPSPTTVSYTVSTSLSSESFTTHATHWLILALRIFIGILAIFLLLARYESTQLLSSSLSEKIIAVSWTYIAPSSLVALYLVFRRFYTGMPFNLHVSQSFTFVKGSSVSLEESLLVVRSLGIQTSSISPYYLFPPTTRFIPTSQIRDLFIHEAFKGFEVRYYLAVVVDGESEVVVVFPVSFVFPLFPWAFVRRPMNFVSVIKLYNELK